VSSVDAFVYDAIEAARCLFFTKSNSSQQCCRTKAFSSLFYVRVYFCIARCRLKPHYFYFVNDKNFLVREVSCIGITYGHNRHQRVLDVLPAQTLDTKASTTLPPLSLAECFFIFSALF